MKSANEIIIGNIRQSYANLMDDYNKLKEKNKKLKQKNAKLKDKNSKLKEKNKILSDNEVDYIVNIIMKWIYKQYKDYKEKI